ncbi:FAD-dependent oxidoreductase [Aquincola sp. S2]|uniref:FAD-dependent oxidoreductase n=1 Tax=Pseudaquabacterium terrae TaxID=2732868 RepID=A0ABX2EFH5_9BURK|nr:FAD-dependent oxidoreductase [Aquabacterium terrae]NRF67345.1 FAD-dependent oxidoreductase [Aquabacterium terrae]
MKVLVIGAGPAGLNAACAAAASGAHVTLLDQMPASGGRLWAGSTPLAVRDALLARADRLGVQRLHAARVIAADGPALLVEPAGAPARWLAAQRLVLATGARERQLPFPGWTLPGVVAAGGLQLMLKAGLSLRGRRVVIAGTGPLLLAAADSARAAGAQVMLIAEQAPRKRVLRFAAGLHRHPDRLLQALRLRLALRRTPYRCGWRLVAADAAGGVLGGVRLADARGTQHTIACDLLAISHGLLPELPLPTLLGCARGPRGVLTDTLCATSQPGIFAAGESTGIGGVAKACLEGRIAGFAAAGRESEARALGPALQRERAFAEALHQAFEPRREESPRPDDRTLLCRCEDVRWADVARCADWREARLQTRCGMGHCQGRLCAAAAALLKGWSVDDVRPPFMPARAATLALLPVINPQETP